MIISPMTVTLIDSMGSDLSVVNAARVSFAKESEWETIGYETHWEDERSRTVYEHPIHKLAEKDQKLIAYLAKHGHWTPFAHAFLSFRIKAPVFVARQLVKHQVGLAWNEVSRRYVDDEPEFWFPDLWRKRAENVKQGSSNETLEDVSLAKREIKGMLHLYQHMLGCGISPEQARMVLPQNMHTEWLWSGSLAAFARVVKLRTDPHAQAETREIAEGIEAAVPKEFKHSWEALLGSS